LADGVTVCLLCGTSFPPEEHRRFTKDGYAIVRCPSCTLLFRRDLPTQAELDEIYGLDYFQGDATGYLDYVADADLHRAAARNRLDLLERLVAGGALLDVGAAAGFFVDEARSRGWDAQGIDVSEPMVEWGRRTLDVPLERATLADVTDGPFDALTMWDYIEHSLDPAADLRRAQELLRPGGVLALSTGDAATWVARLSGSRWHLLTPRHHNFFFTAATLGELLARSGFEVVSLDHRGGRYPVRYLVHKLGTLVPSRRLESLTARLAASRLGAVAVPVNLRDIATVAARKK
jgi:2-polyprenyl-3-methyl-5-hydroxy-6-metoxy-1,4-benzoquinol methylase